MFSSDHVMNIGFPKISCLSSHERQYFLIIRNCFWNKDKSFLERKIFIGTPDIDTDPSFEFIVIKERACYIGNGCDDNDVNDNYDYDYVDDNHNNNDVDDVD